MIRLALIAALGLVSCARPGTPPRPHKVSPRAALVSPTRIELSWEPASDAAGSWIEFSTPGADWVKLEVAWPDRMGFTHADLAPETTFIYRLVPFFGHASPVVPVRTGTAREGANLDAEGPLEDGPPALVKDRASIRSTATRLDGAPGDLTVSLIGPTTAVLRWRDRALDEDGYLVELAEGGQAFKVCSLI